MSIPWVLVFLVMLQKWLFMIIWLIWFIGKKINFQPTETKYIFVNSRLAQHSLSWVILERLDQKLMALTQGQIDFLVFDFVSFLSFALRYMMHLKFNFMKSFLVYAIFLCICGFQCWKHCFFSTEMSLLLAQRSVDVTPDSQNMFCWCMCVLFHHTTQSS